MKNEYYIAIVISLLILSSCGKELSFNDLNKDDGSMPRYLSEVTEYLYPNNYHPEGKRTLLFGNPKYNDDNQITFAYVNFTGEESNHSYSYSSDVITVSCVSVDGVNSTKIYQVEDGMITKCTQTGKGEYQDGIYNYYYDSDRHLSCIHVSSQSLEQKINISWVNDNIVKISAFSEEHTYEYITDKAYKPYFPLFNISCVWYGGYTCLDEVLVAEGYFGESICKDLPVKEYYFGEVTREFSYDIDKSGFITKIKQGDKIRDYTLIWN